jgi:hypothetical protein
LRISITAAENTVAGSPTSQFNVDISVGRSSNWSRVWSSDWDGGNHCGAEEEGESGDSGELHFELRFEKLLNLNGALELLKLSGVLVDGLID